MQVLPSRGNAQVKDLLALLAAGVSQEDFLQDYLCLENIDIHAVRGFVVAQFGYVMLWAG
ncbi:MAG: DUF433 domain-containing protein [Nitrospira sp.]|jgi:uncharacterized protein (DUF433 family)|nr:DUF433 domain-containing protein [Nitrospira sp.]